jgi:hypothetical protein
MVLQTKEGAENSRYFDEDTSWKVAGSIPDEVIGFFN